MTDTYIMDNKSGSKDIFHKCYPITFNTGTRGGPKTDHFIMMT